MIYFPYKIIDLTHTVDSTIPTWSGDCGFNHTLTTDYKDCESDVKFRVMDFSMNAGVGTHMDAPSHCVPGGRSIHEINLEKLCMPAYVIDVSKKTHERYSVSVEDIITFESLHGMIKSESSVMIKTGWERFWKNPDHYRNNHVFPSVSLNAANFLLKRGVSALGIDTLSADRPEDGFNVHQAFLSTNCVLLENVANLDQLPAVGAFILAFPLKIKDATESPMRLVGLISK